MRGFSPEWLALRAPADEAARDPALLRRAAKWAGGGLIADIGGGTGASFRALAPLLVIALGFGLWSRERERRTLAQALSTGVEQRVLGAGKASALGAVIAGLLGPAALIIIGVLWALGGGDGDTVLRVGLLLLAYGAYFAVYGGLTLYTSAVARSSRAALVTLVGVWGLFTLVLPRAAGELAGVMSPLPSRAELARTIAHDLEKGVDGETDREATIEQWTQEMMAEKGIAELIAAQRAILATVGIEP